MKTLAHFLRSHRERIMQEWELRSAQLPSAQALPRKERRDHIPDLLDAMADAIERGDTSTVSLEQLPLTHAGTRWQQEFDLREIVAEYRLLRRVVLDIYHEQAEDLPAAGRERPPPLITFNENLDHAITDAVDHYSLQRDRMREYFVGMLSHDLRDPLHTVLMTAEMQLMEQTLPPAELQKAQRIVTNARRMKRLIDDMLDVTRGRLGSGLPISPVTLDLNQELAEAVDELAEVNPGRRIEFQAHRAGTISVQWDPLRLSQAVANLVANALKHGADPIVVTALEEGAGVVVQVSNAGEIPADMQARMFEPFETRDPNMGTGLGLFIVSEVARAHGGRLVIAPDTPGETRFRMELPRLAEARVH